MPGEGTDGGGGGGFGRLPILLPADVAAAADAAESTCPIKITLRLNRELNIRHIAMVERWRLEVRSKGCTMRFEPRVRPQVKLRPSGRGGRPWPERLSGSAAGVKFV